MILFKSYFNFIVNS